MRADHDVDFAFGQRALVSFASFASTKRDSCRTVTGKPGEALGEIAVMLARQQRGRHHDRDLLARSSP